METSVRGHRLIPALLVVALLIADLAIQAAVDRNAGGWPRQPGVFGLALVLTQVALVAAWIVWGRTNIALRVGCALGVLYLLASTAAVCTNSESEQRRWFTALLFLGSVTSCLLAVARLLKLELIAEVRHLSRSSQQAARQFSIWGILSTTTVVACLLGATRQAELPGTVVGTAFAFCIVAVLSCSVLVAPFLLTRPWVIAAVVAGLSAVGGYILSWSNFAPPHAERASQLVALSLLHGVTLAGAAAILRIGGYRLLKTDAVDS